MATTTGTGTESESSAVEVSPSPRAGVPMRRRIHHHISPSGEPITELLRELLDSRDLFVVLLGRELRIRYKQTALGVGWVLLQPLLPAVLLSIVLGRFAQLPSAGAPYLLFALSGFVLYQLFAGTVTRSGQSLIRDGGLIAKVYFPRAVLPLAAGMAGLVDFLVGLAAILVLTVVMGLVPGVTVVVALVFVTLAMVLALAVGLAVATLTAHYRDVGYLVGFGLQLLLYGSPVMYSLELLPAGLRDIVGLNPLVALIEGFRWGLLGTPPPSVAHLVLGAGSGALILATSVAVYVRASRDLADVI